MRILVTGTAGFIGSHLSERLLARAGRSGALRRRQRAGTVRVGEAAGVT